MGSTHWEGPHLASDRALGGAAEEMHINATAGEGDMVTVFDDFDDVMPSVTFGDATGDAGTNVWEDCGWVMTDDPTGAPTADLIGMNDPADVDQWYPSCIRIFPGTGDDDGGNMQLDLINADLASGANNLTALSGRRSFPHLWIPETAAGAAIIDNTIWAFGCRIGFHASADSSVTDWEGKVYIGWAEAGDTSVMDHDTGVITQAETGPLVGFHIGEDGSVDGISQRTVNTAYAEGTNFTELLAAGGVDGTVANGASAAGGIVWLDLALRMNVTDMSNATGNGATEFFWRRLSPITGAPGQPGVRRDTWQRHPTVLLNQTPNNDVALVPTIEVMNGPTAGSDVVVYLDWWTFGCSRISR